MRPALVAVFAAFIAVPLAVMGWLGVRASRGDREVLRQQVAELTKGQLAEFDRLAARVVHAWEQELLRLTDVKDTTPAHLRAIARRSSHVRTLFVIDPDGRLRYPVQVPPPLPQEREFLDRVRPLRLSSELSFDPPLESAHRSAGAPVAASPPARAALPQTPGRSDRAPVSSAAARKSRGWFVGYYGRGLLLLFWRRMAGGQIVGAELEPVRFLSDLIAELPGTGPDAASRSVGRIVLTDLKGASLYQWGVYDPPSTESPQATLALSPPLDLFRLECYRSPDQRLDLGQGTLFGLASGLLSLGLVLVLAATYLYREYSRDLAEAAQRVSFVNQVSHELKTPLTNIRMYAELLADELAEESQRRHIAVVVSESQRLSRLIANILTFARKTRNKLALKPGPGRVDDAVRAVLEQFAPAFSSKRIEVDLRADAPALVQVDVDAIGQIVGNLLSNVEKYAAAGGRVEISTVQKDGRTEIVVSDRGPGIPPGQEERIFAPFYRLDSSLTEGVAGTGIGLSIARDLARLHGGDLVTTPGSPGATFRLTVATPFQEVT
ncbi:MAG: HAMP domain-containing histidine kinase [Candidatus Riflebacteria bacterium]|nr:HAMP domain-containing histidine kinase [Candidatus Riflebacteria bacterium]